MPSRKEHPIINNPKWECMMAAPAVVGTTDQPRNASDALSLQTLRERADFPSFVVVASSLGLDPTASAPPRLRKNLPRSRPRGILRQAPRGRPHYRTLDRPRRDAARRPRPHHHHHAARRADSILRRMLPKQGHAKEALTKFDEALKYAPHWVALKAAREAVAWHEADTREPHIGHVRFSNQRL